MCIHVCVRARIQDSHVHVRGRPSWSTECISLCQPVAKIPLRNRSFGGEPWSDTRETQTVTVAHLLVILAVHLWHHLMWKRQDFFSHLLVGRSSLSICSCVIKSLKDLTAICLCYINYQDEAVQKNPPKHFEAPPLFISLTNTTANWATSLHFMTACQSLEKICAWTWNIKSRETTTPSSDSPRWLTPNCISKPSTVLEWGHIMMPALFMRIFTCFSSEKNIPRKQEQIKEC